MSATIGSAASSAPSCDAVSVSIASTRAAWRPPSNGVASQRCTIRQAVSGSVLSPESASMLASLCWRAIAAVSTSCTSAARTRGKRFAVYITPRPLPQITMPRAASPTETARAAGAANSG
jgi:hypothetical protein